jgi:hypothetical protein
MIVMMNNWIKFKAKSTRTIQHKMHVTLGRRKDFYLSSMALDELGRPKAVCLFYDVPNSRVGMSPAPLEDEDALPLHNLKTKGAYLSAGTFCSEFGIRPESRIVFQDIRVNADGIMVLDLRTAKSVGKW